MESPPVPRSAVALVVGALVALSVYLTLIGAALAGDGALYLVEIVAGGDVVGRGARSFANDVREAPVLLGVHGGVSDLRLLALLLGVGQLVVLAVAWATALVLARSSRLAFSIVVLAAGLCAGSTWMFSNAESTLGAALTILLAVLLWLPRPWRALDAMLALGCALVLVRTHETIVVTSVVVVGWAALRSRAARSRLERAASAGVALLALATIALGVVELVRQRGNPPAHDLVGAVRSLVPLELYVGLLGAVVLLVLMVVPVRSAARPALAALGVLAGVAAAWGWLTTNGDPYRARGGAMLIVLLAATALFALWLRSRRGAPEPHGALPASVAAWLAVGFALVLLGAVVPRAERWSASLQAFRAAVAANHGIVPVHDVLPPDRRQVLFDWTSSSLSVVLRDRPDAAVLVDAAPSFVPFPPTEAQARIPPRYTWR